MLRNPVQVIIETKIEVVPIPKAKRDPMSSFTRPEAEEEITA